VTATASLIVTVTVTTSPAFKVALCAPVAPVIATEETVGAMVSTFTETLALAALAFVAWSVLIAVMVCVASVSVEDVLMST